MLEAVKAHALAHYGEAGWDYVVEAWTDADILNVIAKAGATTDVEAIAAVGAVVGVVAAVEADVRGWGGKLDKEDTCEGCGAVGRYYEGLCYQCQCDAHAVGEYDMDGDGWRVK